MPHTWRKIKIITKFCSKNLKGKHSMGDLGVGNIKWILKKRDIKCELDLSGLGQELVTGPYVQDN
jgi:hypothetical protein